METRNLASLYPQLCFRKDWSLDSETHYHLGKCAALVDSLTSTPIMPDSARELHVLSLKKGAQATTAIEGNTLTEAEIDEVLARNAKLVDSSYQEQEVANIYEAFNTLLDRITIENREDLISPELLLEFHRLIGLNLGEKFAAVPGQFAQGQRIVGASYRAPRPEHVPELVQQLSTWLRAEFRYPHQTFSEAIIQAIVTHVYIEWIHPFDDGNGRTGRLAEFYILVRAGLPSVASHLLANHYNETRPEYYRQLQRAGVERSLTSFIKYAVSGFCSGLEAVQASVRENLQRQMWRGLVYDSFASVAIKKRDVFRRQREIALALPIGRAVPIEDIPTLNATLREMFERASSPKTLLRDLRVLEGLRLVRRSSGLVQADEALLELTFAKRRPSGAVWETKKKIPRIGRPTLVHPRGIAEASAPTTPPITAATGPAIT